MRVFTVVAMETRKQQFNSAVSDAIVHLQGREQALAPFGWTGEKAGWIAFVCLHSGAFTHAQCARFLEAHPEQVRRVVHALIAQGLAAEETVSDIRGISRVCRIFSRRIYRALGAEHIRHRRDASREVLMWRLLSLDYVIEHPGLQWLATEAEKVAALEALGIERGLLPVRLYRAAAGTTRRYFPVKLPIALDSERAVFVYVDPGHATALRSWGGAHRGLWHALRRRGRSVEVVAVARTSRERATGDDRRASHGRTGVRKRRGGPMRTWALRRCARVLRRKARHGHVLRLRGRVGRRRTGSTDRDGRRPPLRDAWYGIGEGGMCTPMPPSPGVAPELGIRAGRPFSAAAGRRIASSTDRPAGVSELAQRTGRGPAENTRPWAAGNVEP